MKECIEEYLIEENERTNQRRAYQRISNLGCLIGKYSTFSNLAQNIVPTFIVLI